MALRYKLKEFKELTIEIQKAIEAYEWVLYDPKDIEELLLLAGKEVEILSYSPLDMEDEPLPVNIEYRRIVQTYVPWSFLTFVKD